MSLLRRIEVLELAEANRDYRALYAASLRAAVRGLWSGVISPAQFSDSMFIAIRKHLAMAWEEGAARCGVLLSDYSPEEVAALRAVIQAEYGYVAPFGVDIGAGSQANGGKLAPFIARTELWANRYTEVVGQAEMMACGDEKFEWLLGRVKTEHCADCKRLHGKVKRASTWAKANIHPQSHALECNGYHCKCRFEKTDKPVTPGPLPRLANA